MRHSLEQHSLVLSLSKDAQDACARINPHRECFDKLSMSGNCK